MADRKRKNAQGTVRRYGSRKTGEKRPKAWIFLSIAALIVLAGILGLWYSLQQNKPQGNLLADSPTPLPALTEPPRETLDLSYPGIEARDPGTEPSMTANPNILRDLSYFAEDATFTEKQINAPGIFGNELFFSAGTGNLDTNVLTKLYLYNLETKKEEKISTTEIYMGEYYETLINEKWLIYLETDHGKKNNIYVRNRETGQVTLLKTCTNGKPKLRLSQDNLIWMEQEEKGVDYLYMVDLVSQENLTLFTFEDVATYGVSAPAVYGDWIVWAAPDPTQTEEERKVEEHSAIYYLNISCDFDASGKIQPRVYTPGTYVHEPYFNGEYFLWIDTNKSFNSNLYIAAPGDVAPKIIDTKVTAYGLGDDVVVYGRDSVIWIYVIPTGETCRLTSLDEKGMLPQINGRTAVWLNNGAAGDKDTLRFKILTDEDLYPYGKPEVNATPNPYLAVPDATTEPDGGEDEPVEPAVTPETAETPAPTETAAPETTPAATETPAPGGN